MTIVTLSSLMTRAELHEANTTVTSFDFMQSTWNCYLLVLTMGWGVHM